MNKGKNTTEKNICRNLIQLSFEHVILKSYDVLIFHIFTTVETYISVPYDNADVV